MKKCICILLMLTMLSALFSCGKKSDSSEMTVTPTESATPTVSIVPSVEVTVTPTPTEALSAEEKWYQEILDRSLMNLGNNYRLRKVIEKAQAGEDVYIGFIGGSITEGEGASYKYCYASQTFENFKKAYGVGNGDNIHMINAGVSGTPSTLGVIRYERDLIEKNDGHKPDLLIIEFAVNDADDPTNGATYEGLIRRTLYADNSPAVVLLFSVFQSRWNLQDRFQMMGRYYQLPMVSIKDAVVPCLIDGSITDAKFFNDAYHPKMYGHTIMADCLGHLFEEMLAAEPAKEDAPVREDPFKSSNFDNVHMLTVKSTIVSAGSFTETDKAIGTTRYDNQGTFPDNWKHTAESGTKPLTFTVTAKSILLTYKKSNKDSFGKIDVYVDGKKVTTIDGYDKGGWNQPYTAVILNEKEIGTHKVEVRMAPGSEKKDFTIMAFGYGD